MATKPIVTPLALSCTREATLTLPWFVQQTEYFPVQATFCPLVNGEEAFGAVYEAIAAAKRSVDIICWGFQPSMYFKRGPGNTDSLPIGHLLAQKGAEGIQVRVLCWQDDLHMAEWGENNMPGNNAATSIKRLPGMSWLMSLKPFSSFMAPDYQKSFELEFDREWYRRANLSNATKGQNISSGDAVFDREGRLLGNKHDGFPNLELATRDFGLKNRAEIQYRTALHGKDADRSTSLKVKNGFAMGTFEPTHHQKMVLVDYETPDQAVGFVMGHNMLDTYWDRDDHSFVRMHPHMGRNGTHPRQDISSRVTGPILRYLNENFCQAWDKATGQNLDATRALLACQFKLRRDIDTPVMAQILRTQSQHGKRDIETMYLQAVNNTTKFIYIENQYFRFVPLADKIKAAAQAQLRAGRDPGKHGPLHLFVVTNSNDEGIGAGTVNTYRMLESLGRADTLPGVAQAERVNTLAQQRQELTEKLTWETGRMPPPVGLAVDPSSDYAQQLVQARAASVARQQALKQQIADVDQKIKDNNEKTIVPTEIPGLKVHVCTLVAPDSPPKNWDYVYVHAKLMVVDDAFMTLGSANINTRSMEADSELNICHEHAGVTAPLRKRLWGIHTKGMGAQEDVALAFKAWDYIIDQNAKNERSKLAPYASLVGFMRTSPDRSYLD
ncbi:phospholipase D-like domain-containing protein [Ralstonia pseudosolanacearum]|uniref:phospholipase D-like domain-containing protein n=1 Tax=Ralstonia pseudosolanacearum TaxID=1310165 RepID=UPI002701A07D|nr:phospholipase D-like domain-containing protein [Ralstonia pseudosolanacearum]MDO3615315.1 phospholipase D-like domain-containing protein [Ralstonia pseudosolanacearum]